jgi:hypothetical protein
MKGWFLEEVNKIKKPLAKLKGEIQLKLRDEKGNITTATNEIHKIIW